MGDARRRKKQARNETPEQANERLRQAWQAMLDEGGGTAEAVVLRPEEMLRAVTCYLGGDDNARRYLEAAEKVHAAYLADPASRSCFCCSGPIRRVAATVLLWAHAEERTHVIGGLICQACDGTRQELNDRMKKAVSELSDLRALGAIHPTPGRA